MQLLQADAQPVAGRVRHWPLSVSAQKYQHQPTAASRRLAQGYHTPSVTGARRLDVRSQAQEYDAVHEPPHGGDWWQYLYRDRARADR